MKSLLLFVVLLMPFGWSWTAMSAESRTITIDRLTLALEVSIRDSSELGGSVGISPVDVNEEPIVLNPTKQQPEGPLAPAGDIYSDTYVKTVEIQGAKIEVQVSASYQIVDGEVSPYSVRAAVRPEGKRWFDTAVSIGAKNANTIAELEWASGWSQNKFWLDEKRGKVGQARLEIKF